MGSYVNEHPRGKKYRIEELKKRRDQIYAEQTSALVPLIDFRLSQQNRKLPNVGFQIAHHGQTHPAKAYVTVKIAVGSGKHLSPETIGHYDGRYAWNVNPGQAVYGLFKLRSNWVPLKDKPLRAKIEVTVADIYDYPHRPPSGWLYFGTWRTIGMGNPAKSKCEEAPFPVFSE